MPRKNVDISDRQQAALTKAGITIEEIAQNIAERQVRDELYRAFRQLSVDDQIIALTQVNANPLS